MRRTYLGAFLLGALAAILLASTGLYLPAQSPAPPAMPQTESEPNAETRQLAPGETQEIPVHLLAHQTVDIDVEQLSGNVLLDWKDAAGNESPFRFTQDGRLGHIRATIVADRAGTWQLKLAPRNSATVEYSLRVGAPRAASDEDVLRAGAGDALAEAEKLRLAMRARGGGVIAQGDKAYIQDPKAIPQLAEKAYREAIGKSRQINDGCGARDALNGLAHFQIALGQYSSARASAEQAVGQACDDKVSKAHSLRVLQGALGWLGDLDAIIGTGEQALEIYRETGDLAFEGLILGNLSSAYDQEGETGKGLDTIERALDLARKTGDREGVVFDEETMGAIHLQRGDYQQALDAFMRTLEDLKSYPDSDVRGMAENDLASTYAVLGDEDNALTSFKVAQATASAHGNPSILVDSLTDEGRHFLALRQYVKASTVFHKAIAVVDEKKVTEKRAKVERGLGAADIGEGHFESGIKELTAARELARSQHDDFTEIESDLSLGDFYFAQAAKAKATEAYEQAATIARRASISPQLAIASASLARVQLASGDLALAQVDAKNALDVIDDQRSQVNAPDLRSSFFQSTRGYYDLYIRVLMGLEEKTHDSAFARTALETAENARARALTDLLSERAIDVRNAIPDELLNRRSEAQDALHAVAYRLTRLPANAPDAGREALDSSLSASTKKLDGIEGEIRAANHRYSDLKRPEPLSTAEIQKQLLDENTVLLEYWLSENGSYLWEITSGEIRSYRLPAARKLDSLAVRLRELLSSEQGLPAGVPLDRKASYEQGKEDRIRTITQSLSSFLLNPVAHHLGTRNVVIVADGSLRGVPFGILPLSSTRTLEQRNGVTYLPSIGALRWLRKADYQAATGKSLAIFADPVFDLHDSRLTAKTEDAHRENTAVIRALHDASSGSLTRLAWSRREAQIIARDLPGKRAWVAVDFDANRSAAIHASWQDYSIAHFATHALIDSRNPELSGIVLSLYDSNGRPVDGFLRVTDIYNLAIPAQLVVLSTCDSAADSAAMGNDIYTLSDAFFYAGAPRILATLWSVNDEAAAVFMAHFYRALLARHMPPSAALQSAKAAMARDPRWKLPYYWSGFVLEGDWR